ncbi:hypothetical protein MHYP_G00061650 [Metynnis hypsauchen]
MSLLSYLLQMCFCGPYEITEKLSTNYVLATPDRRRNFRTTRVNMLKPYVARSTEVNVTTPHPPLPPSHSSVPLAAASVSEYAPETDNVHLGRNRLPCARLPNSHALQCITGKLSDLPLAAQSDLKSLFDRLSDIPSQTSVPQHDIDVNGHPSIRQHLYRVSPHKRSLLQQEAEYLLENGFAVPSNSPWCSPCLLVLKPDTTYRFCTDYRKLCSGSPPAETHEERGGQRPRLAPSPETDNDDHHRRRSAGAPSLPQLILDENTWNSELCSLRWMWIGLDVVCTIISLHSSGTTVDVMAGQSQLMFGESFCRPSVSAVTELIRACDLWSTQFFRVRFPAPVGKPHLGKTGRTTSDHILIKSQKKLMENKTQFQQRIQEREKEAEELRNAVESQKRSAQTAVEKTEKIFADLIRSIERRRSDLTELIRAQENAAVSRAEGALRRLEEEISELRRRNTELEQLSLTEDHIHFLQSFQPLSAPPGSAGLTSIMFSPNNSFQEVLNSVSQLGEKVEQLCEEEFRKISSGVLNKVCEKLEIWLSFEVFEEGNVSVKVLQDGENPKQCSR